MNKNIKKQNLKQNLSLVPGKRRDCKATKPRLSPYNAMVFAFTNSIPKGIRMWEFNLFLRNRKA